MMSEQRSNKWRKLRSNLERQAVESKDAQEVAIELVRQYERLAESDRADVDRLLQEWVLSDVEAERFDALVVIDANEVRSAAPALRELCSRLEASDDPGAPYEWEWVNRILGGLLDGPTVD